MAVSSNNAKQWEVEVQVCSWSSVARLRTWCWHFCFHEYYQHWLLLQLQLCHRSRYIIMIMWCTMLIIFAMQTLKNNNARLTTALQESAANVEEWKKEVCSSCLIILLTHCNGVRLQLSMSSLKLKVFNHVTCCKMSTCSWFNSLWLNRRGNVDLIDRNFSWANGKKSAWSWRNAMLSLRASLTTNAASNLRNSPSWRYTHTHIYTRTH